MPTGVTFTDNGDGTATLAGTPGITAGGTFPITITASNGIRPDASQSFTLTVSPASTSTQLAAPVVSVQNGSRTVALSAMVTSLAGVVSQGSVTFTLVSSNNGLIGSPVSVSVVNGAATGSIRVPLFVPPGAYKVVAAYSDGANLSPSAIGASVTFSASQPQIFAVGAGAGGLPIVRVYDTATGNVLFSADVFEQFSGGVRVATGVFDGQNVVIAGAGPGGLPLIRVLSGDTGKLLFSLLAFDSGFAGGVYVAAGDLKGDGSLAIVAGADGISYGSPVVSVHDVFGNFLAPYITAFDPTFRGGVRVAVADLTGTGKDDIVAAQGPGGPSLVQIINGQTFAKVPQTFSAFPTGFQGGVFVAAGRLDNSGLDRLVFGSGPGPNPTIRVEDATGQLISNNSTVYPGYTGAVPVAVVSGLGQSLDIVLASSGVNGPDSVTAFDSFLNPLSKSFPTFTGFTGDSFVA